MPIRSEKNLYPGINPHINSFLQDKGGGWESFHAEHIVDIIKVLNRVLPPNYYAAAERSLQVLRIGLAEEIEQANRPDVTIFRAYPAAETTHSSSVAAAPAATLPLWETLLDDEDELTSAVIYELDGGKALGRPVTRLELLSRANKPGGVYYGAYMKKRNEVVLAGMALVELDYLHETRPLIVNLPSYRDGDHDAFPYTILVSKPSSEEQDGIFEFYGFGVLDPILTIGIPIGGEKRFNFDFGAPYQQTYESSRLFQMTVDYEKEPERFHRYSDADQAKIRQQMAAIAAAHTPSDE